MPKDPTVSARILDGGGIASGRRPFDPASFWLISSQAVSTLSKSEWSVNASS